MSSPPATAALPAPARSSWPAALAALAVTLFYAFGLPAINRALPGTAPQPAGVTVELGHGVSVVTPAGWSADVARINPGETLALTTETSSLVATTFAWQGNEADMIERSRRLFEGSRVFQLRGTPKPFRTRRGIAGATYAIFSEQADGRVWIGLVPGGNAGFAVRVRSIPGQGGDELRDATALVESVQFKEVK